MKRQEARKRAAELVGRMTLEEKASQLRFDAPGIGRLGIASRSEKLTGNAVLAQNVEL